MKVVNKKGHFKCKKSTALSYKRKKKFSIESCEYFCEYIFRSYLRSIQTACGFAVPFVPAGRGTFLAVGLAVELNGGLELFPLAKFDVELFVDFLKDDVTVLDEVTARLDEPWLLSIMLSRLNV